MRVLIIGAAALSLAACSGGIPTRWSGSTGTASPVATRASPDFLGEAFHDRDPAPQVLGDRVAPPELDQPLEDGQYARALRGALPVIQALTA